MMSEPVDLSFLNVGLGAANYASQIRNSFSFLK